MSSEFVRYAPEIETIDPHFDESLAQIIDFVEKKGRESPKTEGAGRAVRAAHAKSFGLVKAEVEILPDVPAAYAQGIYAKPGRHDLQVQLCTDLTTMPVNLTTTEWPEAQSPYVTVARVRVPRQDISGQEINEKTDALSFNQWRVTEEHRPLGEIMNVRRIYSASAKLRCAINQQPQSEPASADAVLS